MKRKFFTKAIIAMITIVLAMTCMIATTAYAEESYELYFYEYSHTGVAVCTQLTVRDGPSTGARELCKMKNGQSCIIVGQYNNWYMVDLASLDGSKYQDGFGFAQASLIKSDPYWIVTTKYTHMYTDPWKYWDAKENGQQSGRVFLVISENPEFYCVQCRESTAGSSFIYKRDIGRYTQQGQSGVIVGKNIPMYNAPWGEQTNTLDNLTIVNVDAYSDIYCHVTVNFGKQNQFDGWVESKYVQQVIN